MPFSKWRLAECAADQSAYQTNSIIKNKVTIVLFVFSHCVCEYLLQIAVCSKEDILQILAIQIGRAVKVLP